MILRAQEVFTSPTSFMVYRVLDRIAFTDLTNLMK